MSHRCGFAFVVSFLIVGEVFRLLIGIIDWDIPSLKSTYWLLKAL